MRCCWNTAFAELTFLSTQHKPSCFQTSVFPTGFPKRRLEEKACRLLCQPCFFLAEPSVNLKCLLLAQFFVNSTTYSPPAGWPACEADAAREHLGAVALSLLR